MDVSSVSPNPEQPVSRAEDCASSLLDGKIRSASLSQTVFTGTQQHHHHHHDVVCQWQIAMDLSVLQMYGYKDVHVVCVPGVDVMVRTVGV